MKYSLPLLALASGAVATFRNAKPFPCPANQDNKCTDQQKPGYDFTDLPNGGFQQYKDFNWNGWTSNGAGGGRFGRRTGGRSIGGICSSDKKKSPSFGCGPKVDKFSLGSIHVQPEFDCDLEFHYDMPDGSTCKHRNSCRKSGTTVVNTQCGGAKNVTIVYPPQPNKPKPSCSIVVPTVSFDCSSASSTVPPKTTSTPPATTSSSVVTVPTSEATIPTSEATVPTSEATVPTSEATVPTTSQGTTSGGIVSTSETTPPVISQTTYSVGESSTSSVKPGFSSSFTFPNSSSTAEVPSSTPGIPGTSLSTAETTVATPETTASTPETPATSAETTTYVTTFDSTSTLFTTVVSTITSCETTVTNCPASSIKTTVVTIATSTTICPVTETHTSVVTPPTSTSVGVPGTGVPTTSKGIETTKSSPVEVGSSSTLAGPPSSVTSISPIETLPCPSVVPSCLNTFLFSVGCSHNSDAACYCPDTIFVKNIFNCIYAHGESDQVISEAVLFFQGICAPHLGSNPGIVTDATITTYLTATATQVVSQVTTVTLDVTTVVPCTDENGSTIENSSSTTIVSATLTVPQVGFTTGTNEEVNIIPGTTALPAITQPGGGFIPTPTGFFTTPAPTGTGGFFPSATPSGGFVTAGAGRTGAGVGFAVAAAGFIAALL